MNKVSDFKYLGCEISTLNGQENINNRLNKSDIYVEKQKRNLGHKTWKNKELKFSKTMALLCLMLTRALRGMDERRLEAADVQQVTAWDKKSSAGLRPPILTTKLDKQIHERKKNWLEHLQEILSEGAPK